MGTFQSQTSFLYMHFVPRHFLFTCTFSQRPVCTYIYIYKGFARTSYGDRTCSIELHFFSILTSPAILFSQQPPHVVYDAYSISKLYTAFASLITLIPFISSHCLPVHEHRADQVLWFVYVFSFQHFQPCRQRNQIKWRISCLHATPFYSININAPLFFLPKASFVLSIWTWVEFILSKKKKSSGEENAQVAEYRLTELRREEGRPALVKW